MTTLYENYAMGATILIADDDESTLLIMRSVLEAAGFVVVSARDGAEAMVAYEQRNPDAVLLDVDMPELDGFTVCERIRAMESGWETPVIIVTGHDDDDSVDRAFHTGATDFIAKPIPWSTLPHRVRYVIRSSGSLNDMRGLIGALPDSIFILDEHGEITNGRSTLAAATDKSEYAGFALILQQLVDGPRQYRFKSSIKQALETGAPQSFEHFLPDENTHLEIRITRRDRKTVLAIIRDATDRKKYEQRIYDLAYFDTLTGLPNRLAFTNMLDRLISSAADDDSGFALLFIDIDRFKRINDTMGHSVGDDLLIGIAKRLETCLRSRDLVARVEHDSDAPANLARLGGDEFVVVLQNITSETDAARVAERIQAALLGPFSSDDHQLVVTPSIGIALYPQDGRSRDELLMNADSAMYKAKAAGRNNFKFFSDTMRIRSMRRLKLEVDLRSGLKNDEFELYFQPKADLPARQITGLEALVRWNHPTRGWVSPGEFIPVAEESGLILPLGRWILSRACQYVAQWAKTPMASMRVAINISSIQVQSDDFLSTVKEAVSQSGCDPNLLELEITEGVLMHNIDETIEVLTTLKRLGINISVDDFGTGYSSLAYLKRLPIDVLKIDQSFVRDLHVDPDDAGICAAILAMGQKLGLRIVAEGVEREEQVRFLQQYGCDQIQGFLLGRPMPPDKLEAFLAAYRPHTDKVAGL